MEGAGPAVVARVVVARVVGDGHLAKRGRVPDGALALERGTLRGRHDHRAGTPILAIQSTPGTGVFDLTIFSNVVRRAAKIGRKNIFIDFSIYIQHMSKSSFKINIELFQFNSPILAA